MQFSPLPPVFVLKKPIKPTHFSTTCIFTLALFVLKRKHLRFENFDKVSFYKLPTKTMTPTLPQLLLIFFPCLSITSPTIKNTTFPSPDSLNSLSVAFSAGTLEKNPQTICTLDNQISVVFQNDANLVVYDIHGKPLWATYQTVSNCGVGYDCILEFQGDGNLVTYYKGVPLWNSRTGGGSGTLFVCTAAPPYLYINNAGGGRVWDTGIR